MKKQLLGLVAAVITLGAVDAGAQALPPFSITLTLNSAKYILTDPNDLIQAEITLQTANCNAVIPECLITPADFTQRPFHLLLTFTDPDGTSITAPSLPSPEGPPPPIVFIEGTPIQAEPVGFEAGNFLLKISVPDVRAFYPLTRAGRYSAKLKVSVRTYPAVTQVVGGVSYAAIDSFNFSGVIESNTVNFSLIADADGDGYAFPEPDSRISPFSVADCDDNDPEVNPGMTEIPNNGKDDDCNPATPDTVATPTGAVVVKVEKHTVGSGTRPVTRKDPLPGVPVGVFDKSAGSCASKLGISWQKYKSIWLSCQKAGSGITDASGTATVRVPPGNYVVIGEYDPGGGPLSGNEVYIGVSVGSVASGATVQKYLQVIVRADGTIVPAKYTERTGSLLRIIEPEYVEWNGGQELYPFIFDGVGDWTVTTSVSPPPGFVADYRNLTANVNTTLSVVQFTVTDVGSDWVSTRITHRITHKGKSQTITSQIGVRLSEHLAKAKGLTRLGQPLGGPPRP